MSTPRISGLDFFKLLGVIAMTLVHAGLFLSRGQIASQPSFQASLGGDLFLLLGFFSLSLPALAGASLRVGLDKYTLGTRLLNYDFNEIIFIGVLLMALESLKNALIYQPIMFYYWDVLHFIGVSIVIVVVLMVKWGLRGLAVFTALSLILGALVPPFLADPQQSASLQLLLTGAKWTTTLLIFTVPSLLFFWLGRQTFPKPPRVSLNQRRIYFALSLVLGIIVSLIISYFLQGNAFFRIFTESLPLGALFQLPQANTQMWPLFPWFSLVGLGYLLSDIHQRSNDKTKTLGLLIVSSLICFLAFYFLAFDDYRALMVEKHNFSLKVFSAPLPVMLGILSFYTLLFSVSTLIFNRLRIHSGFIYTVSRGMLIYYILHFMTISLLYKNLPSYLNAQQWMFFFPWVVFTLTYFFLIPVLRFLDRPINVHLRRRS